MAIGALKRPGVGVWPMLGLFVLLLVSLSFMSDATHNSERFGQLYSWLLLINALGLVVLTAMIGANLYWLVCQYRQRTVGARLTGRLVTIFVLLAVLPVSIVYYFSLQFLQRGIDSWFNVQIEHALEDALDLSRSAFDVRLRDLLRLTQRMGDELTEIPSSLAALGLYDLRVRSGAVELTLLGSNGRIIGSSSAEPTSIVPNLPGDNAMQQVRRGQDYVSLDPIGDAGLHVRAVVNVPPAGSAGEPRILQALYEVPERLSGLADSVQDAFVRYKELAYLREPLKYSYILTLSLVLLLSLLSAVWAAFYSARRLVAPVRDLAEGTRAVAAGDYDRKLPIAGHDELGMLVQSFNEMTQRLAQTRDAAQRSQQEVESQRAYLAALLGSLSSGVISVSADTSLRTCNEAAARILGVDPAPYMDRPVVAIGSEHAHLLPFVQYVKANVRRGGNWRGEITVFGASGRQVLTCSGVTLSGAVAGDDTLVIVLDDVTALIQAQRDAAWAEVARRLAHEIKNPLTPIQLSAERLRRKFMDGMAAEDREVLDRSTHTIVQQVEAMKEMVNAFSDYARAPKMQREPIDLNALTAEVLDLYQGASARVRIRRELDTQRPKVMGDPGRLRQVLHNLIKNAQEASADAAPVEVHVTTRRVHDGAATHVELCVEDNGPGFADGVFERLFEPYVTTKPKGTGLGLAIVKKIVEEHGGVIAAENRPEGGARLLIQLQALAPDDALVDHAPAGHGTAGV